ncbi:MAG TPA: hypothetical protein VHC19_25745, partial [Pirellulales bacterium]|nr:hypothetical protein [Pirellulales bacterium]
MARQPKYRHNKARGTAFIEVQGRRIGLGKFNSPESLEKYHRILAELAAGRLDAVAGKTPQSPVVTVNLLIQEFLTHAKKRYVKHGKPTSEVRSFKAALKPVRRLYGRVPVDDFGPRALRVCRQTMIDDGGFRKRINKQVSRIRQVFKWGVSVELVEEVTWAKLRLLEGLRKGELPDRPKIRAAT